MRRDQIVINADDVLNDLCRAEEGDSEEGYNNLSLGNPQRLDNVTSLLVIGLGPGRRVVALEIGGGRWHSWIALNGAVGE